MVKAVIGEETRLKSAEDHLSQSAVPSQVGLVIGKITSSLDRCLVFDLVPTPPNDAGEPACSLIEADKKKRIKRKISVRFFFFSLHRQGLGGRTRSPGLQNAIGWREGAWHFRMDE